MTERMCKVCGKWHDLEKPWPARCVRTVKHGTAPNVISDDLGKHLRHMGTGRMLDSKSAFRKEDKAIGAVCVGNEATAKPRKYIEPPRPGPDIKRAIEQLRGR
jgi:hypothetical protein